jgi:hypothetical protein
MGKRRAVAIAFSIVAASISATFAVLTSFCGMMSVEGNDPGAPSGKPHCVSAPNPVAFLQSLMAMASIAALWKRVPAVALVLGLVSFAVGVLAGLSGGFFTIIPGALSLAAGIVGMQRRPDAALAS